MSITTLAKDATWAKCFCGEPAVAGSGCCQNCLDGMAEEAAKWEAQKERRQRLQQARAERTRHLAELATQGCGCASEAECKMDSTDWHAVSKSKSRKLYEEMLAACARSQRWRKEADERGAVADRQREAERQERARAAKARWEAVTVSITPSPLLASPENSRGAGGR